MSFFRLFYSPAYCFSSQEDWPKDDWHLLFAVIVWFIIGIIITIMIMIIIIVKLKLCIYPNTDWYLLVVDISFYLRTADTCSCQLILMGVNNTELLLRKL